VTRKTTGHDLETAMAELLELRAKVRAAARFNSLSAYKRKNPPAVAKRSTVRRRNGKPRNRTR
jgi:hypothetical protein